MSNQISFLDIKRITQLRRSELEAAAARVFDSGWLILGEEVSSFEAEFAAHCGARYCIGVANGLDALSLTLRAFGIQPGDEVIVPSNTYIATWLAVSHIGAIPVPVEPDPTTYNIDPARIEAAITDRTRAIVPVHLYGQPADLEPIIQIAERYNLRILEDGAQAHGARYRGTPIGGHGNAVAWSFYPGKNLGALGDGGAVTTDDPHIAEQLKMMRNYGSRTKYHNELIGYNSRLDELQAAFLRVKLPHLANDNHRRREIASAYLAGLADVGVGLPAVPDWAVPVWHLFVIQHPERDALSERLKSRGVATMIHYPVPPHLQPAYAGLFDGEHIFPISETIHRQVLSLPMDPTMTDAEVSRVIDAVRECA